MGDVLQLKRGTTSAVNAYTGPIGEVVVNTTSNELVIQDGVTAGGWPIGHSGVFVPNETPSGVNNGINATFTLQNAPRNSGSNLMLFIDGILVEPGSGNDYTISGVTLTLLRSYRSGAKIRAYYWY